MCLTERERLAEYDIRKCPNSVFYIVFECISPAFKMTASFTLLVVTLLKLIAGSTPEMNPEDCGDAQDDVENGMIRLPEFSGESIRDLNCSWTYTAPAGRKLLVKVDSVHIPPMELRTSQFKLYVDDQFYDIPRNCVKCLRDMIAGKVLNVIFTSYVVPLSELRTINFNETTTAEESIGSFQVRYKAFDPYRCSKPEQIENGFFIGKGRNVDQNIFYKCNPPYDLIGYSEIRCVTTAENPLPVWNSGAPSCVISECSENPIKKEGTSGAIASPGYPHYIYHFTSPCIWQITAQASQQIKISVTYFKFPQSGQNSFSDTSSRLSFIDGNYNSYIVNLTDSITNEPFNLTTLTNNLIIVLDIEGDSKKKEANGVYIDYSVVSSSCPKLRPPNNGEIIAYNSDLGSRVMFACKKGFLLVGELRAECLYNGQWSHPIPTCEPINVMPTFLSATNHSDTLTHKFEEIAFSTDSLIAKYPKNARKKASQSMPSIDIQYNSNDKDLSFTQKENDTTQKWSTSSGSGAKFNNKHYLEGPKSEPHLLQVVPPKENGKKSSVHIYSSDIPKAPNWNQSLEHLPQLESGITREIEIAGFRVNLNILYIVAGVSIPLLLISISLAVLFVYRRKYPVRMRFGRKFSTFENPMYVSKDAHHPRELKRLTN